MTTTIPTTRPSASEVRGVLDVASVSLGSAIVGYSAGWAHVIITAAPYLRRSRPEAAAVVLADAADVLTAAGYLVTPAPAPSYLYVTQPART